MPYTNSKIIYWVIGLFGLFDCDFICFVFYVDDVALVYLINKPQVYGIITRWLLLFLEYDFKIVYKPSRSHLMIYNNRLSNQAESVGVPN
jgi:hypothetical protein